MNIDIENINKIEKRHKLYTKLWSKIYEVIKQEFFDETKKFPVDFIKYCNNNANESNNIPIEIKIK